MVTIDKETDALADERRMATLIEDHKIISDSLRRLYSYRLDSAFVVAGSDFVPTLVGLGDLPGRMISHKAIVTSYGPVNVTMTPTDARRFEITYPAASLPAAVCSTLISAIKDASGGITVGGTQITTPESITENCLVVDAKGNTAGAIVVTSKSI